MYSKLDDKPYWFDVEKLLFEYSELADQAFASFRSAGKKWMKETCEEGDDPVLKFSKGNFSTVMFLNYYICSIFPCFNFLLSFGLSYNVICVIQMKAVHSGFFFSLPFHKKFIRVFIIGRYMWVNYFT